VFYIVDTLGLAVPRSVNFSSVVVVIFISVVDCPQCFDAVGWAAGRASSL